MKNLIAIMALMTALLSSAQTRFEKGYFIDNQGQKTECLIKNVDWKFNPTFFDYKATENTWESNRKNITEIKEFGVYDKVKFVRETVAIDQSSQNEYGLTRSPNPIFKEETVFLKVLVEGHSNLYFYESELFDRYFFSKGDKIEQLIYKKYQGTDGNNYFNERYKQQLLVDFSCKPEDKNKILKLDYSDDLVDYFIETNNCKIGSSATKSVSEKKKFTVNYKLNVLANSVTTTFENLDDVMENGTEKKSHTGFGFGFEAEIIMPYNNNSWSLVLDPSYNSTIKDQYRIVYKPGFILPDYDVSTKFHAIRIPFGIRRYIHLNKSHKFFINASVAYSMIKTEVTNNGYTSVTKSGPITLPVGIGYQFNRFNLELKYFPRTTLSNNQMTYKDNYLSSQLSLKLGYRLF